MVIHAQATGDRRRTEKAEDLLFLHAFLQLLDILDVQQVALEDGLPIKDEAARQDEGGD